MKSSVLVLAMAAIFSAGSAFVTVAPHSITPLNDPLNTDTTALFSGSGNCVMCHASNGTANWSVTWGDVSQTQLWQASMMANAARDPYWQAKVTSEVALFPQHQSVIEDICTTCHSPIGRTQAHYNGQAFYSLTELQNSPIGLDGVSCTSCHQIQDVDMGSPASYDGNYTITDARVLYGPFDAQFGGLMQSVVNYQPLWSPHMRSSEMCATCHTLITTSFDSTGAVVGEFVEQVPYIEWKNSVYEDQGVECQACHMPSLAESIRTSIMPPTIDPRDTVHLHDMVGGNAFMLRLMQNNAAAIGATFTNQAMDTTIARTVRLLTEKTARLSVTTHRDGDSVGVEVLIENLSGHKFPTAYPARRAWLHVTVTDPVAGIIFESGQYDTAGIILNEDVPFEPHYDVLRSPSEVQIYELVARDCYGQITHSLLKSYEPAKDNRLVPVGFMESDATYDTVRIVGDAENDPNFNTENGEEGSGTDRVTYRIPYVGAGPLAVEVEMLFQAVNPRAADFLFTFNTAEVNAFEAMYMAADKTPVRIASSSGVVTSVEFMAGRTTEFVLHQNYPNPFNPQTTIVYELGAEAVVELTVYNALGQRVRTLVSGRQGRGVHTVSWDGRNDRGEGIASGIYLCRLKAADRTQTRKLMLVK